MIVAGIGFTSRATRASLDAALALLPDAPQALATAEHKAAALRGLAPGLPVIAIAQATLAAIETPTQSGRAREATGAGSLAEAAALAAAGTGAELVMSRRISPDRQLTIALAQGRTPRNETTEGQMA